MRLATRVCHTGGVDDEIEAESIRADRPLASYYRWIKDGRLKSGSATVALGAAMVAVGEILEPEKASVEIEQTVSDPLSPDLIGGVEIDFGGLPELN